MTTQGSFPVTARGICWSTNENPTIAGEHTLDGTGTGSFTSNLTQLKPDTQYYVRSYATNSCGTAYGDQVIFSTQGTSALPKVQLMQINNITTNSATIVSTVNSEGGSPVTMRGVCWSNTPDPTIANSHTTDGAGLGSYTSEMTGLLGEMIYYVRSYATNDAGTAYTMQITFETLQSFMCGDTIQYGGQVYHTLAIGTQCWMKENLNVGTRIDGSQNQTDNNIIEKYCYDNLETNCAIYGGLYQWNELIQYAMPLPANQGICPNAWHIPTDTEFTTLFNFLGGAAVAGGKLKEEGTAHWSAPNTGATNSSGFMGLPAGYRHAPNKFNNLSLNSYLWTTPKYGSAQCWTR